MWPFEGRGEPVYLRVGALAVERWQMSRGMFTRTASEPLRRERPRLEDLAAATKALLTSSGPRGQVTLVIESAWMPVLLAATGPAPLSPPKLDALLRHRFDLLYRDGDEPVSDWNLRADYRPGDDVALGFGLPAALEHRLLALGKDLQLRWAALLPAFAWGDSWRPRALGHSGSGWWIWPEQDRLLVARIESRRIVALNAGAMLTDEPAEIDRLVEAEAARFGATSREPIGVATWASKREPSSALTWYPIGTGRRAPKAVPA